MKLPIEGMTATVISGVVLTALLALLVAVIPGAGVAVALAVVIALWLIMFWLLVGPTPAR
ncbi:MAG: hypothetical protein KGJ86_15530 [Chloroflexota bacterium]|nr:hypothetical protein [Chloroflexota bacterium]